MREQREIFACDNCRNETATAEDLTTVCYGVFDPCVCGEQDECVEDIAVTIDLCVPCFERYFKPLFDKIVKRQDELEAGK